MIFIGICREMDWTSRGVSPTLLCCLLLALGAYETGAQGDAKNASCSIVPTNRTLVAAISKLIWRSAKILEDMDMIRVPAYIIGYNLEFPNRPGNETGPLTRNLRYAYKPNNFLRVLNRHGMTLLTLAFNYGVISLSTLSFGTHDFTLPVAERPARCLDGLSEKETLNVVLYLLARDLNLTSVNATIRGDERICFKAIEAVKGKARFSARCYDGDTVASMRKSAEMKNKWISFLYASLAILKLFVLFYAPLLLTGFIADLSGQSVPYIVKLKEPLVRTMYVTRTLPDKTKIRGRRYLDLSKARGCPKLRETLLTCPLDVGFTAKISQYDILAANTRLIKESEVPMTVLRTLAEAVFGCKMKNSKTLTNCCYTDMLKSIPRVKAKVVWLACCYQVGVVLFVFCVPFLYYLRLFLFYKYEVDEISTRSAAAARLKLGQEFNNNLVHYFKPTHPLFITIYAVYFASAILLAILTQKDENNRFRNIVVGSFADLQRLSYINVAKISVENTLWPFRKFGILGFVVGLVYWTFFLPATLLVAVTYSLPSVYLVVRMLFYSRQTFLQNIRVKVGIVKYQSKAKYDKTMDIFKTELLLGEPKTKTPAIVRLSEPEGVDDQGVDEMHGHGAQHGKTLGGKDGGKERDEDRVSIASSIAKQMRIKPKRFLLHITSSTMCIISLISLLLLVAECVGSLTEIAVFTTMGVIVNAGVSIKYLGLVLVICFYTFDCFNAVKDKYRGLNKALFPDLKKRIKDLNDVTALPSYIQENQAFKSQEQSQQAAHEKADDIAESPSRHWLINDLVLFVDSEDTFRIPRRLFKAVSQIKVAGVPGPIHEGIIHAFMQLLRLIIFLAFVFVVVQCFGNIYEVSNSIQTVAIVGSGLIPMVMSHFMKQKVHAVEVNTLSFTSKLDEVVRNFWQLWPIHDFNFQVTKVFEKAPEKADAAGGDKTATAPQTPPAGTDQAKSAPPQAAEAAEHLDDVPPDQTLATEPEPTTQPVEEPSPAVASPGEPRPVVKKRALEMILDPLSKVKVELVDILVRVPKKYEDQLVDGWSNIVEYTEVKKKSKKESEMADVLFSAFTEMKNADSDKKPDKGDQPAAAKT